MFVKFERHSDRVKSVSFHPHRPWVLSALHSGVIEMIDYRIKKRIATYEDHKGAVRSVQFHPQLNLFCSGGDDFTVRVWNFKQCQFILQGHLDYVRCVTFHPINPWVLSGSDDQTARVWNYQSRQTIAILTGHTHYIMACHFHPTQDLIITCSLDQTARLWSYGVLKQRYAQKKNQEYVLSGAEVQVISILDAHKDQLNWCAFHKTEPFIITSADDKNIKLWKYNDTKAWEYDTLSGHTNNVCCSEFHPKGEVIISDSEDHTVRIWDYATRKQIGVYENKHFDRYWIVSCHQNNNYFACGSDTMLQVFTLHKDRVPFILVNERYLCMAEQKTLKVVELTSGQQQTIRDIATVITPTPTLLEDNIEFIEYNAYDTQKTQLMIRCIRAFAEPTKPKRHLLLVFQPQKGDSGVKQFFAKSACFIGKSKIARINQDQQIELYNYETEAIQIIDEKQSNKIFPAPGGKILIQRNETTTLELFDPLTKSSLHSVEFSGAKYIHYVESYLIVQSKLSITIFTKQLQKLIEIQEQNNIKSFIWINNFIIYSTKSQVKYLLLNGDTGVLKSTENILYLVKGEEQQQSKLKLTALDNAAKYLQEILDISEPLFKIAIMNKDLNSIHKFVEHNQNEAILSYLYQKRLASVALKLVKDKQAKFSLSLDSGNLEFAYKAAVEIREPQLFEQLRTEALRQGNHLLVDICDQQLSQFDRLSFLYLCTGNTDKQEKLQNINPNFIYQSQNQRKIAIKNSIPKVAQIMEHLNGTPQKLDENQKESIEWIKALGGSQALIPPVPIMKYKNDPWPLLQMNEQDIINLEVTDEAVVPQDIFAFQKQVIEEPTLDEQENDTQWRLDEEEPIEEFVDAKVGDPINKSIDEQALRGNFTYQNGEVAIKYFAAGDFETGIKLLKQQINLNNCQPLFKLLADLPNFQVLTMSPYLSNAILPVKINRLNEIKNLIKLGYKYTTDAKFSEVSNCFQQVLQKLLLTDFEENQVDEIKRYINLSRNYMIAMRCDSLKKDSNALEMACKMATIDLQPGHRILTLRQALSISYKQKNFITCQMIAKKLIELLKNDVNQKPEVLQNAQKYEKASQQQNTNAIQIEFQEQWLNEKPIYSANTLKNISTYKSCPYDGSVYETDYQQTCLICGLCKVGKAPGLKYK
ncbi:unnamed protein product (macronuclear) [Paramecium tetraurelia]|uniref:Beta'-coat protein n=1 Tax=Paramecium tetraurelia TaxID=5888 RepID=A0EI96_PARTE|nr:uncharacterized protein GSPATT00027366001 [Paramecium tetraurelia]CAK95037.1 unnamed protein product [Paramecium tetraurelia]|eukprot:XP_001462410.1 hypothetical protein (macronuclear) [Paramecium tetraurelia strain d4-2]